MLRFQIYPGHYVNLSLAQLCYWSNLCHSVIRARRWRASRAWRKSRLQCMEGVARASSVLDASNNGVVNRRNSSLRSILYSLFCVIVKSKTFCTRVHSSFLVKNCFLKLIEINWSQHLCYSPCILHLVLLSGMFLEGGKRRY